MVLSPGRKAGFVMEIGSERELGKQVAHSLKVELKRCGVTYAELARRLEQRGMKETEASIANKLASATFSATFMLAVVAALGIDQIDVRGIYRGHLNTITQA